MANTKITSLTPYVNFPAATDIFPFVDVSDTTMAATGTTKGITAQYLMFQSGGTASLSGAFTVPIHYGSTSSGGTVTISSTSNATKGKILLGSAIGVDEVNGRLGVNTLIPTQRLEVNGTTKTTSLILGSGSTLSEYSEGTFTPGLTFGGGATSMTFSSRSGRYVKIGKMVYVSVDIRLSAKGSSTGGAKLTNLPYVSASTTAGGIVSIIWYQMNASFVYVSGAVDSSSQTVTLVGHTGASASYSALTEASFANNSIIQATIMYESAS